MKRSLKLVISDMLESVRIIEGYAEGASEKDFESNTQMQDSVIRRLAIIGEACKSLPETQTKKYANIPWKKIIGMRDILVHAYYSIINERIWKAVKEDIPQLKKALLEMEKELKE